jgi:Tol biopolymer transport system component
MTTRTALRRRALVALTLVVPLACGDGKAPTDPGKDGPPQPTSLALSNKSLAFTALGDSIRLLATIKDQKGATIADASIAWSSTDTAVARVNASGWVATVGNGAARVVATSGTLADTATIDVAQVPAAVQLGPDSVSLAAAGDTVRLAGVVTDANGVEIAGAGLHWASADSGVARVDSTGLATAVAAGVTLVVASAREVADTATVFVAQVAEAIVVNQDSVVIGQGATLQLEATVTDRNGIPIRGAATTWSSANASIVDIDHAGLLTAVLWGSKATVTASSGTLSTTIPVRIMDQLVYPTIASFTVINEDSSLVRVLPSGTQNREPVWSPDGQRIFFVSDRDGNREIYVINADGSGETNLTNGAAWDGHLRLSPDGSKIVFETDRDGDIEIYVMDADGGNPVNLTNHPQLDLKPIWSPDGSKIAFWTARPGNYEIYVMDPDGNNVVNLSQSGSMDRDPSWSPDASKVVFQSDRTGVAQIYLVDVDGNGLTPLTDTPEANTFPLWSPDGQKIAFISERDGDQEIYLMNPDGSGQTRLTDNPGTDNPFAWSPDGRKLYFQSQRDGGYPMYVVDIDTGALNQVVSYTVTAAWKPRP